MGNIDNNFVAEATLAVGAQPSNPTASAHISRARRRNSGNGRAMTRQRVSLSCLRVIPRPRLLPR